MRKTLKVIIFLICAEMFLLAHPNYKALMDEIASRLDNGYEQYEKGNIEEAKELVTMAYFEVFENLEGPIRINISSKKSYLMESQFGDFRKMITKGVPKEELKEAIESFKKEMDEVLPELEGGYVLKAEATMEQEPKNDKNNNSKVDSHIPEIWQNALKTIQDNFNQALSSYEPDNSTKARDFIQSAQFEGYRNTMLEIAIRQFVSSNKETSLQSQFLDIIKFIHTKPSKEELAFKLDSLMKDLNEVCVGLKIPDKALEDVKVEEKQPKIDFNQVKKQLFAELDKALAEFKNGNNKKAISIVQNSYFDIFEGSGMENAIGAKNANLKVEIESYFSKIVALMKKNSEVEKISKEIQLMSVSYDEGAKLLSSENQSFLALFIYSLSIILREGFEALLIVTAIIAYLVKTKNTDKLNIVYSSVSIAILLSFITAAVMNLLFGQASAENREILEGATMLVASLLLFYVSYWLLSNASAKQWTKYIKENISQSLDNNSRKALWLTSFLAVYREGAETVLFYQALIVDAVTNMDYIALVTGFLVGVMLLLVVYYIMKFTAIKLPIKLFFTATGILIYIMAFIFIGKGVMELVEGRVFQPSLVEGMPTYTPLGVYPYLETLIPQAFVIFLGIVGIYFLIKNAKKEQSA